MVYVTTSPATEKPVTVAPLLTVMLPTPKLAGFTPLLVEL